MRGNRLGPPEILILVLTGCIFLLFGLSVNLTPEIQKDFFFSSDDPQFLQDKQIREIFPEPQQIIIGVKGDIRSGQYINRIEKLTLRLSGLPDVFGIQSITEGPGSIENAFQSPLWKRILVSDDGKATNLILFIRDVPPAKIVPAVEGVTEKFRARDFQPILTGPPYILFQIQKNLIRDLRVFSLAAFALFGLLLFCIFRSFQILLGTALACLNASMITLLITQAMGIEISVLTANLSTIVFVLTLSHCIFLTFNWRILAKEDPAKGALLALDAVKVTGEASFWSMLTTLLGFGSLIFAHATPLQKLGMGGAIGTFTAFATAYLIYPWFLRASAIPPETGSGRKKTETSVRLFFGRPRQRGVFVTMIMLCILATGAFRLDTDPSLLTYFRTGSDLREGLEYMDRNGGSSPLKIVLRDKQARHFNTEEIYGRLWDLQSALESHESVGSIISLPLVMAEGRKRIPLSFFLSWEWLLRILEMPVAKEVASYFVTSDRSMALFVLRMKESGRTASRQEIQKQLETIVRAYDFSPALAGGVFLLQGNLAHLVTQSLMRGLILLIGLFAIMGFLLSRSVGVTASLLLSLCMIPAWLLGWLGHWRVPLDIISAPATNIAIAMGVDAMIHTLIFMKRALERAADEWEAWTASCYRLWKPVLSSAVIVCAGFGIFSLSQFPPTQRFGFAVILGTLISPAAALFILPNLAFFFRKTIP